MKCPYCEEEARWVSNEFVYGKRYGKSYMCYWCPKDEAYVGCHNNTRKALGTMANKELRAWRKKAHAYIDPLWQSGQLARAQVYYRLNKALGFEVHVGGADIELCKKILSVQLV